MDKFHYFIRHAGFQKVFPNENNYFKVLNSEYFDDDWYRNTYNLESNTDSVIHFLLVGYAKGYNPGPNFSISEYYECNEDVAVNGKNPLVHYELCGRKENRIFKISDIYPRNYSVISNSHYFDEVWYRSTYDLEDDVDCIEHYLKIGCAKYFNPGPDFSTFEYYESNHDVKEHGSNPLVHYELYGRKERRKINVPDEIYNKFYSSILNSPYFDGDWYGSTYDIGDWDAVEHYLKIGYVRGFNPSPDFSTDDYFESNPDVKEYGINPLLHYELHGKNEKRCLNIEELNKRDYSLILDSSYFDSDWYRRTYDLDKDIDCVEHYLNIGFLNGFNPDTDFSTYEYYECNKDIKEWKMNPLVHYELYGRKEKRPINIAEHNYEMFYNSILDSPYFDKDWYKSTYDIGDWDAVEHYMKIGYARGFNPGPDFSTNDYYECNPDIKEYGMNALVHYEIYGRAEGRKLKKSD